MSLRIDTAELIFGAYVIGDTGLGVLGSAVPSTGTHGPSYLYNDLVLPADANKEVRGLIVTPPSAGTFCAYEDGSFSLIGAANGNYTFVYRLYVDGADLGTATATININSFTYTLAAASGAFTLSGQSASLTYSGAAAPTPPTVGRPVSDTSNTGWVASAGISLYATIDEVVADDSDYIYASSAGNTCQIALSNTTFPGAISQVFEFRASSPYGNTVQVRLKNTVGGTVATWTQVLSTAPTTYRKALTAVEIALITSGALSLELTAI